MPITQDLYRLGETKRIAQRVSADAPFEISDVRMTIYSVADMAPVVSGDSGGVTPGGEADEQEVFYLWAVSEELTPGLYAYVLKWTVDGETDKTRGKVTVLPEISVRDRYLSVIEELIQETPYSEAGRYLRESHLLTALNSAVEVFQVTNPRQVVESLTLTAEFEYGLAASLPEWQVGFSKVVSAEYPVDDTSQGRCFLDTDLELRFEETRDKFRFWTISPSVGEVARFTHTAPHVLDDETDSLPRTFFHAICQYAAGEALWMLGSGAIHTSAPQIGADFVSFDRKSKDYAAQGERMKEEAAARWGGGEGAPAAAEASWRYRTDHERLDDGW